jgi:Mce-associated membrane protein
MTEASLKTDAAPDDVVEVTAEPAAPDEDVAEPAAALADDEHDAADAERDQARDETGVDGDVDAPAGAEAVHRRFRRPSRFAVLVTALSAAVIVLAVAGALLFQHVRAVGELAGQRAAVLDSARKVATDLTSISAENAPQRITSLTDETTGDFRSRLSTYGAVIQAVMRLSNAGSQGTVNDLAIERIDDSSASVLVAATAEVSSNQTPAPRAVSYRMVVQLRHDGDRWLVSDVSFVA